MRKVLLTLAAALLPFTVITVTNAQTFETANNAVKNMGVGWNLGNTLDAHDASKTWTTTEQHETCWGQPVTKPELMKMMKEAGFSAIRVPVTWYQEMNSDGKVKIGDANYIQQRISGISAANNRTYAAYVEQTATTSPTQSTQATQATTPTQSTTQITVRFDKGNTNGTPVARCFNDDYEKHTDYTMQHESGNIYKISIPDSFRRIEFWFDNFNQKTQYYDIQNGKTYSR